MLLDGCIHMVCCNSICLLLADFHLLANFYILACYFLLADFYLLAVFTYFCVGIPFNALYNDEFEQMCEAIGKFGPGFEPPSQVDLHEKLLSEEYARTKSLLDDHEAQKIKLGCTIMTDAWTDMKRRSITNVCMHCSGGTSFLKSKETSDVSHIGEVTFELVDKAI